MCALVRLTKKNWWSTQQLNKTFRTKLAFLKSTDCSQYWAHIQTVNAPNLVTESEKCLAVWKSTTEPYYNKQKHWCLSILIMILTKVHWNQWMHVNFLLKRSRLSSTA